MAVADNHDRRAGGETRDDEFMGASFYVGMFAGGGCHDDHDAWNAVPETL